MRNTRDLKNLPIITAIGLTVLLALIDMVLPMPVALIFAPIWLPLFLWLIYFIYVIFKTW